MSRIVRQPENRLTSWQHFNRATKIMLQLHHIHKTYRQHTVCHNINLTVQQGELLAILGKSGSGKSTLLNVIAGLVSADSGDVFINQIRHTHTPPERREIAMMFQDFALLPHLNVWQNVAFGLKMRGVPAQQARTLAENRLAEVGLHNHAERTINQLSGGEQQRVALARALVVEPKVLLLDEPFSSLDTHLRQQLQQQIRQLVKQRHIPAVLVSHDPAEACLMADQIALLHSGSLIQHGTPQALCAQPINAAAARLLGCLNVRDTHYVPPTAIHLGQGEPCTLIQSARQPHGWLLVLQHPIWGEISTLSDQAPPNQHIAVQIDETQIVHFQAA
ncbi:ABC transporter ATP-binding protein [Alysiella filiformis]|nr:ABC transporter ATP-binding protein [Alysiella filiformis]UBQ57216.1 ABC transporter ATP-binding protein [Alysiella filiformis DSM 16848]